MSVITDLQDKLKVESDKLAGLKSALAFSDVRRSEWIQAGAKSKSGLDQNGKNIVSQETANINSYNEQIPIVQALVESLKKQIVIEQNKKPSDVLADQKQADNTAIEKLKVVASSNKNIVIAIVVGILLVICLVVFFKLRKK